MRGLKSPDSISGIKLWFDASDVTTVNDGRVSDRENVYKFVDKIGGFALTNPNGALGPSYSFSAVNGKNAISFTYYNSTVANNPSLKRLAAVNVTPLSTGTFSMYVAFLPNDIRQEPSPNDPQALLQTRCGVVTIISGSRISSSPIGTSGYLDRQLYHTSYYNNIERNTTIGYVDSQNPWTTFNTFIYDNSAFKQPNSRALTSGTDYQYGKVNLFGIRNSSGIQKGTISRKNSISIDNFQPRQGSTGLRPKVRPVFSIPNPCLVIGASWPGYTIDGVGYFTLTNRLATNFSPLDGFFCEMIFFDRVLSESEDNSVTSYLRKKWIE